MNVITLASEKRINRATPRARGIGKKSFATPGLPLNCNCVHDREREIAGKRQDNTDNERPG